VRLSDPKREIAAQALQRTDNASEAARKAGVNRATIGRWLKEADFSNRVTELRIQLLDVDPDDVSEEAERGLARLVPIAEAVIEAALRGEPYNDKVPTAQQHSNALKTIELARKLEPKATAGMDTPTLADLIAQADAIPA
jgi:transposase-like protein